MPHSQKSEPGLFQKLSNWLYGADRTGLYKELKKQKSKREMSANLVEENAEYLRIVAKRITEEVKKSDGNKHTVN